MADVNWVVVGISMLSGGAAGALINNSFLGFRSRKQKISYQVEIIPVFTGELLTPDSAMSGTFTVFNPLVGQGISTIPNLWIAKIVVWNAGNRDFPSFTFGISLPPGDAALHCIASSSDRHHPTKVVTELSPGRPSAEVDFRFEAFNRGDARTLTLYIVTSGGTLESTGLHLSSSEPIVFRNQHVQSKLLLGALLEAGLPTSSISRLLQVLLSNR